MRDETDFCHDCPYLHDHSYTEEFWGARVRRHCYECEHDAQNASDPACPYHDDWLEEQEEQDDGEI